VGFGQYRQAGGCSQRSRSRYYSRKACLSPFLSPEVNPRPLFRGSTSPILSMKQIYRSRMLWRFGRSLYSRWSSTISSLVGLRSQRPRLGNNGWQNSCRRAINVQLTFCHCTGGCLRPRVFLSSEMHRLAELCVFRYGSGTEGFYNYIWDMHSSFPQFPIWITEYADVSDNKTGEFFLSGQFLITAYLMVYGRFMCVADQRSGISWIKPSITWIHWIGLNAMHGSVSSWALRFHRSLCSRSRSYLTSRSDLRTMLITVNRLSHPISPSS